MSYKIDSALVQAFIDGDFGLPIAHENTDYQPLACSEYAELFIVSNPGTIHTLGDGGQDLYDGFMQANLRYPLKTSSIAAKKMASGIGEHFKSGSRFSYDGQEVFITGSGRNGAGQNEDGWFKVVMTIYWEARVSR